jgi:hypothetical protein
MPILRRHESRNLTRPQTTSHSRQPPHRRTCPDTVPAARPLALLQVPGFQRPGDFAAHQFAHIPRDPLAQRTL